MLGLYCFMAKRKIALSVLVTILMLFGIGTVVLVGLSLYYKNAFSYDTWINGVYCTGKTIDEVNDELEKGYSYEGITVTCNQEEYAFFIPKEEVDFRADFKSALQRYLNDQGTFDWMKRLLGDHREDFLPIAEIDDDKLRDFVKSTVLYHSELERCPNQVLLYLSEEGYQLKDTTKHILDLDKACVAIAEAMLQSESEVDLEQQNCFYDLTWNDQMKADKALYDKIEEYQSCVITYRFDDWVELVDAAVISQMLCKNEDGSLLINEDGQLEIDQTAVDAYVDDMAFRHDTIGRTRSFQSTKGDLITVSGGTYGNRLDAEAEKKYLYQALCEKRTEDHIPIFSVRGKSIGKDDIGDTYIEVDMTDQRMYYYENGALLLETDIVTGNLRLRRDTPAGVYYVYLKQRNRILRGPGYASPVKFWMPVYRGIGLHDSSWRDEYGGEIYKTSGSHGCINTPYEKMEQLYEMAEIGTPVVMFY